MPLKQTRHRISLFFLLSLSTLCFWCGSVQAAHSIPFVVDQANINSNITRYSEYLRDQRGDLSLDQILASADGLPFKPATDMEWLGFSHDTWWVRFSLFNDMESTQRLTLHLSHLQVAQATLFSPDAQGTYSKRFAGSEYLPPWGDIRYREPLFVLELPPHQVQTFYLRVLPKQSLLYSLYLSSDTNLPTTLLINDMWLVASIGALLGFLLLNLGFLWRQRDITYLFYATFITFMGLACLTNLGFLGIEFLPLPGLQPRLEGTAISLAVLSSCGFTLFFLGLQKQLNSNLFLLGLLAFASCLSALLAWVLEPTTGLQSAYVLITLASLVLGIIAVRCMLEQRRHARIYFAAQLPLMLLAIVSTLAQTGILQVGFSLSLPMLLSVCIESLILAIGFTQKNFDSAINAMGQLHQHAIKEKEKSLRSEILAKLSHEIRTPMSGITGMTSLLADTSLTQAQQECLATIQDASNNLLYVVNNTIQQSSHPTNNHVYQIFDINQLVTSLIQLFQETAREKHIELVNYVHSNVPLQVRGQVNKVRQCLTNLLAACVYQGGPGDLIIEVSIDPRGTRNSLLFRFDGSSIPVDPDWIALLDAPTQTTRQDRVSVNLRLACQLMEDLEGSSFGHIGIVPWARLILPAEVADEQIDAKPLNLRRLQGCTLLLISDSQAQVRILYRQALAWGMSATTSTRPIEAVSGIRLQASINEPYDAVVFDQRMDEMDGITLAQKIREDASLDRSMILVMLTDDKDFHQNFSRGQHGIQQVLMKPVFPAQLGHALMEEFSVLQPLAGGTHPHYASLRILVAEDHALSQKVIRTMLTKLGAVVDIADNGRAAVEAVKNQTYDMVFMDCEMPEMDGFEATRQIRAWEKAELRKPLPIIALTAHVMRIHQKQALTAGMNDHLAKPIDIKTLRDIINLFMKKGMAQPPLSATSEADITPPHPTDILH